MRLPDLGVDHGILDACYVYMTETYRNARSPAVGTIDIIMSIVKVLDNT